MFGAGFDAQRTLEMSIDDILFWHSRYYEYTKKHNARNGKP